MRTQKATRKVCHSLGLVCWVFSLSAAAWSQTGEWTVYNSGNSGLPYNGVTALAIDDQGIIWVGTGRWWAHAGGGLARFDGTNWTVYNTSNSGLPDNDHVNVCIDAQGNIWSGTEVGLSRFDGVKWTVYRTGNSGMRMSGEVRWNTLDGVSHRQLRPAKQLRHGCCDRCPRERVGMHFRQWGGEVRRPEMDGVQHGKLRLAA